MSEPKLKWEPYGSALRTKVEADRRNAEYFLLKCAGRYKLDITMRMVDNFNDPESAKAFVEKFEKLINEYCNK